VSAREEKIRERLIFYRFWTQFSSFSGHEIHPYYRRLKRVLSTRENFQPLIQLGTIPTVGSK
jgi:hypothetical protein